MMVDGDASISIELMLAFYLPFAFLPFAFALD